jgi:hypothetical protein
MIITVALIVALLTGIVLLLIIENRPEVRKSAATPPAVTPIVRPVDTVTPAVTDSSHTVVPEEKEIAIKLPAKKKVTVVKDTVRADTASAPEDTGKAGTLQAETAAMATIAPLAGCAGDTLMPWVYPDPSGGLHQGPVTIRFHANKPCVILWQRASQEQWKDYDGGEIVITESDALLFRATDRCGNIMETREELYDIERKKETSDCPQNMDMISIATMRFCIDRYEWPNQKSARPQAYVSLYQATDSCFSRGKRLCTSEEWSLACSGPYSWNYPYGQRYEPYACATSDTAPRPSGSKPECRAYFGTFDMAGNLAEWTSTPAKEDRHFNNVVGGFWESGPRSGCFEKRYSYYPQNRHNPVGFRCCKDIGGSKK